MADARRRTLASSTSAIPVPSSIPRPASSMRQSLAPSSSLGFTASTSGPRPSLAPARARASMAPYASNNNNQNFYPGDSQGSQGSQLFSQGHGGPPATIERRRLEPPATATRNNMYQSHGSASVMRNGTMRSSHVDYPQSERRGSAFRRSTIGPAQTPLGNGPLTSAANRPIKDPRDSRSSENKRKWASEIVAFLTERCFTGPNSSGPPTEKQLLQPTGPQFYAFFYFLMREYDGSIQLGGNKAEEVVPALITIGYPFATSITKSHLQSIGSQQSWPNMLAMLHWIVTALERRQTAFELSEALHVPLPREDMPQDEFLSAAWLNLAFDAYPKFLTSEEGDDLIAADLLEDFHMLVDGGRDRLKERVKTLEDQHARLQEEWESLTSKPDPLIELEVKLKSFKNDHAKMIDYLQKMELRKKLKERMHAESLEHKAKTVAERDALRAEVDGLNRTIAGQGMSPTEVSSLNEERSRLTTEQRAIHEKQNAKLEHGMSLEIALSKALKSATTLCNTYTTKAEGLGLLPRAPDGCEPFLFVQELNGAAENPVPDLTGIEPALKKLKANARAECDDINKRDEEEEEKIRNKKWDVDDWKEKKKENETDLERGNDQLAQLEARENIDGPAENQKLAILKANCERIVSTLGHDLSAAEARYDQRLRERAQAVEETSRTRDQTREALVRALEDIVNYKQHMIEHSDKILKVARGENA